MSDRNIRKGTIVGFSGSWSSGMATLVIKDSRTGVEETIPCENTSTVRALDAAYGGIIGNDHTASVDSIKGKEIYWAMDDMGIMLGGFQPVEEASEDLVNEYEAQYEEPIIN